MWLLFAVVPGVSVVSELNGMGVPMRKYETQ